MEPLQSIIQQLFPHAVVASNNNNNNNKSGQQQQQQQQQQQKLKVKKSVEDYNSDDDDDDNNKAAEPKKQELRLFQFDHVIPDSHLLPMIVPKGPSGLEFDFTFTKRSSPAMIDELGNFVLQICQRVPDGIICFFPSYSYEDQVVSQWEKNGTIRKIEQLKKFFREPKTANQVESVLLEYKRVINNNFAAEGKQYYFKGALLSCVVGGKMSEGINFSDGYGRCVIVAGLPYPNAHDKVLKEKIQYLANCNSNNGNSNKKQAVSVSQAEQHEFMTNLCMKAVNQSIGRCIRHVNDYATILLLDKRYESANIKGKLPKWVSKRLKPAETFLKAAAQVDLFFKGKQQLQEAAEKERALKSNQ